MKFLLSAAILLVCSTVVAAEPVVVNNPVREVTLRYTLPAPAEAWVRQIPIGAIFADVHARTAATSTWDVTVADHHYVYFQTNSRSSSASLILRDGVIHDLIAANVSVEVVSVTDPQPGDVLAIAGSSAVDGRILFRTDDSRTLVRPLANPSNARNPEKVPSAVETVSIRNDGPEPLSIISAATIGGLFVANEPSPSVYKPLLVPPGEVVEFKLWFWPLHYNQPYYDFTDAKFIVVTDRSSRVEFTAEGHSTFDADINYDGKVDLGDLGVFRNAYRSGAYDKHVDINQDGVIDLGDMGLLRRQFGDVRPSLD